MLTELKKQKILIVDDIPTNIKILVETLQDTYEIFFATNGLKALEIVESDPPSLILLDIMMPDMNGYDLFKKLRAKDITKNIPIIFITAMGDEEDEKYGFELGAVDYIIKPFKPAIVKTRVKTQLELGRHRNYLEDLVDERTIELQKTQKEIVERLSRASEFRDNETGQHIKRLSHYCALLGSKIGMSKNKQDLLFYASSMHDVGKIGIPDRILLKPGRLTPDEWEIMKTHTTIGADLLTGSNSELLKMASHIALTHHEKWDGSGYPQGLKGDKIPLEGRIVAICDMFDALTSERPYKKAWPVEESVSEIKNAGSIYFDKKLVNEFEEILSDVLILKKRFSE